MKSIEAAWRRISKADDGLEQLCCMVNDNIRLQVGWCWCCVAVVAVLSRVNSSPKFSPWSRGGLEKLGEWNKTHVGQIR